MSPIPAYCLLHAVYCLSPALSLILDTIVTNQSKIVNRSMPTAYSFHYVICLNEKEKIFLDIHTILILLF